MMRIFEHPIWVILIVLLVATGLTILILGTDDEAINAWVRQHDLVCQKIDIQFVNLGPFMWVRSKNAVYRVTTTDGHIFWFHRLFFDFKIKEEINGSYIERQ